MYGESVTLFVTLKAVMSGCERWKAHEIGCLRPHKARLNEFFRRMANLFSHQSFHSDLYRRISDKPVFKSIYVFYL